MKYEAKQVEQDSESELWALWKEDSWKPVGERVCCQCTYEDAP